MTVTAEKAVLGACLLNPKVIPDVLDILKASPDVFAVESNGLIWGAVLHCYDATGSVDLLLLMEELGSELFEVGGAEYLSSLTSTVPTSAHAVEYARTVRDAYLVRQLRATCHSVLAQTEDEIPDVRALMNEAESKMFGLTLSTESRGFVDVRDIVGAQVTKLHDILVGKHVDGLATGVHGLDSLPLPMCSGDFLILAARPSVGKTALALHIASHVAHAGRGDVLFFSLEMGADQLAARLLLAHSGLPMWRVRDRAISVSALMDTLSRGVESVNSGALYIDDSPDTTPMELRARVRRHTNRGAVALIVVDYLQLMHSGRKHGNRQEEVSDISRSLKLVARECGVPLLALSQLKRGGADVPVLADLRESGSIEQDADAVLLLSRTEGGKGELLLSVAKQRNGPIGDCMLAFDAYTQRFESCEPESPARPASDGIAIPAWACGDLEDDDDEPF